MVAYATQPITRGRQVRHEGLRQLEVGVPENDRRDLVWCLPLRDHNGVMAFRDPTKQAGCSSTDQGGAP
jgi:hypothetical protein